jgi:hydrogenase small subunit
VSAMASGAYGGVIRALRGITAKKLDREPKWRKTGDLVTGYKPSW